MNRKALFEEPYSQRKEVKRAAGPRGRGVRLVVAAVAATLSAAALYAATTGLPFQETFDGASLSDAANTTADWGATTAGMLTMPTATPLTDPFGPTSTGTDLPGAVQTTRGLAIADMNGDGSPDIVAGTDGVNVIYLNDGMGNFPNISSLGSSNANTRSIAVGDVNGDGFLDVVAGNLNQPPHLYLNSGDGVTYRESDITSQAPATDSIVLADINGDGHLNVVTANNDKWADLAYLNTGDPAAPFGSGGVSGQRIDFGNSQEVLAGDLNNDGSIDLAFMNENEVNRYCLNDGAGHFACHNLGSAADNSQSGALADLNGDGFLDIVVGNFNADQPVKVYLNTTNPADPFGQVTGIAVTTPGDPANVHRVAVADVNNDGYIDIILSTAGLADAATNPRYTNRILLNDGTGQTFTNVELGQEKDITNYIAAGDLNGDGKIDLVVGNEDRDAADHAHPFVDRVYLNAGVASDSAAAVQLHAKAQSQTVATPASPVASIAMTIDPATLGLHNNADFWVTSNGGTNWLHIVPNGTPLAIPASMQGQDVRWRAQFKSLSPEATTGAPALAIDTLTLTQDSPTFTSTPVTDATVGTAYEYDVTATDPNGDTLTLTAPNAPAWLALADNGDGTAKLTGTPPASAEGASAVEIDASDGTHTTKQTFTITTSNSDMAPSFTSTPPTSAAANAAYTYNIAAADPDAGDTLTLSAPTLPVWLVFADNGDGTGTLTGTPQSTDVGAQPVELVVTDSVGETATQDFTITVAEGNAPPSFTSTPVTAATAGAVYTYSVTAADPNEGDTITLTAQGLPAWLQFTDNGGGTGTLTGTPTADDVGDVAVQLTATDAAGATAAQTFTISVAAAAGGGSNQAPSFTSTPVTDATQDAAYSYQVQASDPDTGDMLTLTAPTLPAWLKFTDNADGTGTLTGTPTADDVGDANVELQVADAAGATASQTFTITVAAAGGTGNNQPPSFTSTPVTDATAGTPYSYSVTAADPDQGDTIALSAAGLPAWLTLTDNGDGTATLAGTPEAAGDVDVALTATDGAGATATQNFTISVAAAAGGDQPPSFTSTPGADITAPTVGTPVSYTVKATDPDAGDTIAFSASGLPAGLQLVDNGDGTATLSGTPTAAGDSQVQITATDGSGATATQKFTVTVAAASGGGSSPNPPPSSGGGGGGGGFGLGGLGALLLLAALRGREGRRLGGGLGAGFRRR